MKEYNYRNYRNYNNNNNNKYFNSLKPSESQRFSPKIK